MSLVPLQARGPPRGQSYWYLAPATTQSTARTMMIGTRLTAMAITIVRCVRARAVSGAGASKGISGVNVSVSGANFEPEY